MAQLKQKSEEKSYLTIDGYRYDITNFIRKHPGGNVIKYYCADHLDATDAFESLHCRSPIARKYLSALPREKVDSPNDAKDPLIADFRALRKQFWEGGYFEPMWGIQLLRFIELVLLYILAWSVCTRGYLLAGGILRGIWLGRNGFFMHDIGHRAFSGNMKYDRFFQWFIFAFGTSASPTFWNNQHNKHHAATQEFEHDVDLNTLPLLAFNERIAKDGNPLLMRIQHITFIPVQLLLFFLWKFTHTRHMFRTGNYFELSGAIVHHIIELYFLRSIGLYGAFVVTAIGWAIGGLYLATIFSMNHTHKPVADKFAPRDWVRRAAYHTTNLEPTFFNTWFVGYLNYQVEHHLFPSMPHPRLPEIRPKVQALFKKHNIPYDEKKIGDAFSLVFENLYNVGHIEPTKKTM